MGLLQHTVAAIFDILDLSPPPYLDQFAIYICLRARCTVLVIEIENHKLNQLELSEDFGNFSEAHLANWCKWGLIFRFELVNNSHL